MKKVCIINLGLADYRTSSVLLFHLTMWTAFSSAVRDSLMSWGGPETKQLDVSDGGGKVERPGLNDNACEQEHLVFQAWIGRVRSLFWNRSEVNRNFPFLHFQ